MCFRNQCTHWWRKQFLQPVGRPETPQRFRPALGLPMRWKDAKRISIARLAGIIGKYSRPPPARPACPGWSASRSRRRSGRPTTAWICSLKESVTALGQYQSSHTSVLPTMSVICASSGSVVMPSGTWKSLIGACTEPMMSFWSRNLKPVIDLLLLLGQVVEQLQRPGPDSWCPCRWTARSRTPRR